MLPHLQNLYALYEVLARARDARGAIDLDTTETYIVCDANGRIEKIVPRDTQRRAPADRGVHAGGQRLRGRLHRTRTSNLALYRVHEGPTPERLANVRTLLKTLGLTLDGGDKPTPADYARLLKQIKPRPDAQLLQTVMLRSMQQAIYSPHNSGHFGLAYKAYTHFTSPIRRYPDLLVHRAIKAMLAKQTLRAGSFHQRRSLPSRPLPRAPHCERSHSRKPADESDATLAAGKSSDCCARPTSAAPTMHRATSRRGSRATTCASASARRIPAPSARSCRSAPSSCSTICTSRAWCTSRSSAPNTFIYNEALHELRGERTGLRYRLGDRLTVQVARVDLEARRIDFRLVKADTRKSLLAAGAAEPKERERKRGETVEERRARQARSNAGRPRRGQVAQDRRQSGVRGRDSKVRATKRGR